MFKDNPLLQQLKSEIKAAAPKVEGTIRGTDKSYGFLETDKGKRYFVPPPAMKTVLHGDRVVAVLRKDGEKESVEPDSLLEAGLDRFIARIKYRKDRRPALVADHPQIKTQINARNEAGQDVTFEEGDWVVARLQRHPLKGDNTFFASIERKITSANDKLAAWKVVPATHELPDQPPAEQAYEQLQDESERLDLTEQPFFTIDSASTKDMDDALMIRETGNGWELTIAIADPTAYIADGSALDEEAKQRAFTLYLPGHNVSMLPPKLSEELCSLVAGEKRPALCCRVTINEDGALSGNSEFFLAWIKSQHKLSYSNVAAFLGDNTAQSSDNDTLNWQPDDALSAQLKALHQFTLARSNWRHEHALIFPERPDYRFEVNAQGEVEAIHVEHRNIAHRMVEESMLVANVSAANWLKAELNSGIFNVHNGLDPEKVDDVIAIVNEQGGNFNRETLLTLDGFCDLRRWLDAQETGYLDARIRSKQSYSLIHHEPGPHYGLGFESYATWTSPIRKYGDMINHRLLKAVLANKTEVVSKPTAELVDHLTLQRKRNRQAERSMSDWLYVNFLEKAVKEKTEFSAEIIDLNRGGARVRLLDNGAMAFVPASLIHSKKEELEIDRDAGTLKIKQEVALKLADQITVVLTEARSATRSLVARLAETLS
ncbi:exoribonuclease II [Corallincola holothuriorum]|uniref:Exoribonuclease II n=1 Tax=Corallincola holothuriorum TaxID=2282215 RepID=A0A368NIX8_9GAMM|nr:exoribonuclease II [Corallincola holothuriorum]RCU50547.1 exoribonuclease II [Corallincola holothuriorum]